MSREEHTPTDEIRLDLDAVTPHERPPTLADIEMCRAACVRFIAMAEKAAGLQAYCLGIAHELAAGRVPNWRSERAQREADLRRRMFDLETFVRAALP